MQTFKSPIGVPSSPARQGDGFPWLWDGAIALGATTLLTAPEKTGKTTLLSLLLDRRRAGGQLLGRSVDAGKTLVCTEEEDRIWRLRQPPLDFGSSALFRQPREHVPMRDGWQRFLHDLFDEYFVHEAKDEALLDLLVIDTAVRFMPLKERNKETLNWSLAQLRSLYHLPMAVLIINQSRNVQRPLAAFADIVMEMSSLPSPLRGRGAGGEGERRRTLTTVGRYPGTLPTMTVELNAEGTDYVPAAAPPLTRVPLLPTLQSLLAAEPGGLTQGELLERWPEPRPSPFSLWRTLSRAVADGVLASIGKGTKSEPFRIMAVCKENPNDVR